MPVTVSTVLSSVASLDACLALGDGADACRGTDWCGLAAIDHKLRSPQLTHHFATPLAQADPEVMAAIESEHNRQRQQVELIASENFVSRAVLEAQGSVLTNKTVEGYPSKRYYGGAQFVDIVEDLARERAKKLFGCEFANVQPHSGSNANQAVYQALLKPADTILSMNLSAGGHISHGHPATLTGRHYNIVFYGVDPESERIDYDQVAALASQHRPRLIIAGGSAYPRILDFARLRRIADEVDAWLLTDMAHFAGLVASADHPHPFPHSHVVTTTTYKSLRGARGGMVLTNDEKLDARIANGVFPGVQGSVLLHGVAGKAVCLGEALQPAFAQYCHRVVGNAQALAESLGDQGIGLVSNGTDTGMILVNLNRTKIASENRLTGAAVVESLESAGIAANKNVVPNDDLPAEIASGFRISTNAGTTRGFDEDAFRRIGQWIGRVITAVANGNDARLQSEQHRVRTEVAELCSAYPFYPD